MKFISYTLFILSLCICSCTENNFSAQQNSSSGLPVQLKKPFPDLNLQPMNGSTKSVSDFKGKVLIINLWASWCEPCLRELPELQKLYQQYQSKGLEVLAINLDQNPKQNATPLIQRFNLSFPIFIDPNNQILEDLKIHAIPFNVMLDKNQLVRKIQPGFEDWSDSSNKELLDILIKEE